MQTNRSTVELKPLPLNLPPRLAITQRHFHKFGKALLSAY